MSCSCLGYRGAQQDQIAKGGETVEPIQPAIVMISLSINLFVMINILLMRTTLTITLSQMIIIFIIVSGGQHIHPGWLQALGKMAALAHHGPENALSLTITPPCPRILLPAPPCPTPKISSSALPRPEAKKGYPVHPCSGP